MSLPALGLAATLTVTTQSREVSSSAIMVLCDGAGEIICRRITDLRNSSYLHRGSLRRGKVSHKRGWVGVMGHRDGHRMSCFVEDRADLTRNGELYKILALIGYTGLCKGLETGISPRCSGQRVCVGPRRSIGR